jgi:1-carboxybiuret hydrolase subunit AtzG-like protein
VTTAPFDPDKLIDATAPLLRLTLTAESRAQAALHLRIAAEHAALLLSAPIDDEEEPAPVFVP